MSVGSSKIRQCGVKGGRATSSQGSLGEQAVFAGNRRVGPYQILMKGRTGDIHYYKRFGNNQRNRVEKSQFHLKTHDSSKSRNRIRLRSHGLATVAQANTIVAIRARIHFRGLMMCVRILAHRGSASADSRVEYEQRE